MIDIQNKLLTLLGAVVLFLILYGKNFFHRIKGSGSAFKGIDDADKIKNALDTLKSHYGKNFTLFRISEQVVEILTRDPNSEYGLNLLLQEVAAHVDFDRKGIALRLYPEKKGQPPGCITKLGSQYLIELHMNNQENPEGVIAVVIHEFCHFFLDRSGISLVNTLDNEILTDAAAVYFGFGRYMREGYKPHINTGSGRISRIGYLDISAIDSIISETDCYRDN